MKELRLLFFALSVFTGMLGGIVMCIQPFIEFDTVGLQMMSMSRAALLFVIAIWWAVLAIACDD